CKVIEANTSGCMPRGECVPFGDGVHDYCQYRAMGYAIALNTQRPKMGNGLALTRVYEARRTLLEINPGNLFNKDGSTLKTALSKIEIVKKRLESMPMAFIGYGLESRRAIDGAKDSEQDALRRCSDAGYSNCMIYEVPNDHWLYFTNT